MTAPKYKVPYGGPVLGTEERQAVIDTYDKGRFWDGEKTAEFEKLLKEKTGSRDAVFTNSGSSALLLALEAAKDRRGLKRGDKVLTAALTFPTAVNIIVQQGYVPVFMDVDARGLQVTDYTVEGAIQKFKPKAAIITHIIGNSPQIDSISSILRENGVIGIEDACDCLGGTYSGKQVGTFLDYGCYSFHPAHPLTAGIGGAVVTKHKEDGETLRRYRDWGRVAQDFLQEERFFTYNENRLDRRYTYSHIAYNLMCSELHAAIGVEQLKKLDDFVDRRKDIFTQIADVLFEYKFLMPPYTYEKADPVWFGYPITPAIGDGCYYTKEGAMNFLENRGIETRSIYGGPVTIQPAYKNVKYKVYTENGRTPLHGSLYLHNNSFWVSVWHGLQKENIQYLTDTLREFMDKIKQRLAPYPW